MGGHWLARGVRVLLLIEGGEVLCCLIRIGLVRVGRFGRLVLVPAFEVGVCPTEVLVSHCHVYAHSNILYRLLCPLSGFLYEELPDGFYEGP